MKNKIYEVVYLGLWMSGKAIVRAKSPEEAIELVKNHHDTVNFTDVDVREVKGPVFYNDNGDY